MAVDRFTRRFQRELEATGAGPIHLGTPADVRALTRWVLETNGPGPDMHRVLDETIATAGAAEIPVRVLVPPPHPLAVIVYYHGGGWVAGSIDAVVTIARKLAERTSSAIVLVGYRLAPEHPHPAASDDAYAALEWASTRVRDIAGKDVPLMVAGDDAGATLAAGAALRARDEHGPAIDMQVLICPVLDDTVEDPAPDDEPTWIDAAALRWAWDQYVPVPAGRTSPAVSPLHAADLSGLPPAVIVIAEHSPARAGAEGYAARLADAGVTVDAQTHEAQAHGFFMVLALPRGEKAFQQVIKAIRAYCARSTRIPS
jgi:acetyl esterase